MEDAPENSKYYVRFPHPYSVKVFFSGDTHNLVDKIFHFANLTSEGREKCKYVDFSEYDELDVDEDEGEREDE
jgi:hypothetical protein